MPEGADGDPPDDDAGGFRLLLSMSPGDRVEVEEFPCGLSYPVPDAIYPRGAAIAPNQPTVLAGAWPLRFAANRPLPDGLHLDESTGVVSGTPSGKAALDLPGWRRFCLQVYRGRLDEQGWTRARAAILKALGSGLDDGALREHARELFRQFDADGSGEIEFQELRSAMDYLRVDVSDEELMVAYSPPSISRLLSLTSSPLLQVLNFDPVAVSLITFGPQHMAAELDLDGSAQIGYEEFEGMIFRMYTTKPNQSNLRKQCTQCRDIFK